MALRSHGETIKTRWAASSISPKKRFLPPVAQEHPQKTNKFAWQRMFPQVDGVAACGDPCESRCHRNDVIYHTKHAPNRISDLTVFNRCTPMHWALQRRLPKVGPTERVEIHWQPHRTSPKFEQIRQKRVIIYDDTVSVVILQRSLDKRLKTRRWIPCKWPVRDNLSFSRRPGYFVEVAKAGEASRGSASFPKSAIGQLQTLDPL